MTLPVALLGRADALSVSQFLPFYTRARRLSLARR